MAAAANDPNAVNNDLLRAEDLLALVALGALPSRPLCFGVVVVAGAAVTTLGISGSSRRGGCGGVVFAALLGPITAAAYRDDSVSLVGCAGEPIVWCLASIDALALLVAPNWLAFFGCIAAAKYAALPLTPATAFLAAHRLVISRSVSEEWGRCLSLAEKLLWSQAAGFLCAVLVQELPRRFHGWTPLPTLFIFLAAHGLFLLALARFSWRLLPARNKPWAAVVATSVTAAGFLLWSLSGAGVGGAFAGDLPLLWLLRYIAEPLHLRMLLGQWPVLLVLGVVLADQLSRRLASQTSGHDANRDKHFVRKSFHALAIVLFAPPLFEGLAPFLSLSLLVASLLFLLLEGCRVYRTPVLSPLLNGYVAQYLDKREDISRGDVVLTHLYLLLGCSLPIWLEGSLVDDPQVSDAAKALRQWAGLLLIGVGDSCAAIFGILYGRHHWPYSHRTLEGSAAFVVSVLVASGIFLAMSGLNVASCLAVLPALFAATCFSALLEVYTESFDNLILPLFFCPLLKSLQARF